MRSKNTATRHPLLAHKAVPLHALAHYPLILCDLQMCEGYCREVSRLLHPLEHDPNVVEHACSQDMMLTLVGAGYGVGFTTAARFARCRCPHVLTRPLAEKSALITTCQPLWRENLAIAMPPRYPLLDKPTLTLDDLLGYPIFRWQAEICPLLDEQMTDTLSEHAHDVQHVTSFELLAVWVAAGYGVGIAAQSRIKNARAWDICMRPFTDAPYEITTYLVQPAENRPASHKRFQRRALQAAKTGMA